MDWGHILNSYSRHADLEINRNIEVQKTNILAIVQKTNCVRILIFIDLNFNY